MSLSSIGAQSNLQRSSYVNFKSRNVDGEAKPKAYSPENNNEAIKNTPSTLVKISLAIAGLLGMKNSGSEDNSVQEKQDAPAVKRTVGDIAAEKVGSWEELYEKCDEINKINENETLLELRKYNAAKNAYESKYAKSVLNYKKAMTKLAISYIDENFYIKEGENSEKICERIIQKAEDIYKTSLSYAEDEKNSKTNEITRAYRLANISDEAYSKKLQKVEADYEKEKKKAENYLNELKNKLEHINEKYDIKHIEAEHESVDKVWEDVRAVSTKLSGFNNLYKNTFDSYSCLNRNAKTEKRTGKIEPPLTTEEAAKQIKQEVDERQRIEALPWTECWDIPWNMLSRQQKYEFAKYAVESGKIKTGKTNSVGISKNSYYEKINGGSQILESRLNDFDEYSKVARSVSEDREELIGYGSFVKEVEHINNEDHYRFNPGYTPIYSYDNVLCRYYEGADPRPACRP